MQAKTLAVEGGLILYDAAQAGKIHEHIFTPTYWSARDALGEPLGGRGAAWRIQDGEIDWVLRMYRRGGLVGKFVYDWYPYTGMKRSRPWREWQLLAEMFQLGLPVPRPVAARIRRGGLGYRGAIITETLPGESLSRLLLNGSVDESVWRSIGDCIRRFHDAGVWHADLNAHNILVGEDGMIYLLDFDRGRMRPQDTAWREANLARLRRSLAKIIPEQERAAEIEKGWEVLRAGYNR